MKRNLFQNIKAQPYTAGGAVDRDGFLSAVLTVKASAAGTLAVAVTHADTADGTFEAVTDERLIVSGCGTVAKDELAQVNIDLLGCKRYVKFTPSVEGDCALVLGDAAEMPVEA